ncbi:MAG TPA: VWA domain-containing protein [Dehalococcoidia bacterium]
MTSISNPLHALSLEHELAEALGERGGSLAENLIQFGRLLKNSEIDVTSGRLIDAARSLALLDLARREDFRTALRANLVSRVEDYPLFDLLFDLYWRPERDAGQKALPRTRYSDAPPSRPRRGGRDGSKLAPVQTRVAYEPEGDNPAGTYGNADLLTAKDFSQYSGEEVKRARRVIRQLAPKLASQLSRRTRLARSGGPVDLRQSLRRSVKHGGEVLDLYHQRRRVSALRLVVLCDVSGSMDLYSRFLVQFLYAMQAEVRHVSTFVFSTRLNEVTHLLKTKSFEEALARIREEVDSWSGGTSIGASLYAFDRRYGKTRLSARTVVIIVSDGWDRGDTTLIAKAMSSMRRRAYKILWLNPLLAGREYQPVAKGMAAALPYIDYFLPAHNLDSLVRLARTLVYLARK